MGVFSWKTKDTDQSIPIVASARDPITVYMWLPDEDEPVAVEHAYEGYGRFGDKDYYTELAKLNGCKPQEGELMHVYEDGQFCYRPLLDMDPGSADYRECLRLKGIEIGCAEDMGRELDPNWRYPQLTEHNEKPDLAAFKTQPEICPDQGFFY